MTFEPGWITAGLVVAGTCVQVGVHLRDAKATRDSLTDIKRVLFGNGKPGLCNDVHRTQERVTTLEAICEERHGHEQIGARKHASR